MVRLLQAPAVGHKVLHHLPVHQGLPSEEIHLQVHPVSRGSHQEIQRLLSHLIAHDGAPSVIFSLFREAVPAGQVAVMGHVQAQRLHHRLTVLKISYVFLVNILRKKLLRFRQLQDLIHGFRKLLLPEGADGSRFQKPFLHACQHLLLFPDAFSIQLLRLRQDLINTIVHNMHASAVHIHHDVVAVISVLMYH